MMRRMDITSIPPLERLSAVTHTTQVDLQSRDFIKYLAMYAQCHGNNEDACAWYLERFPHSYGAKAVKAEQLSTKAASLPGTTTGATWAMPLVGVSVLADGFLQLARSASLLGR